MDVYVFEPMNETAVGPFNTRDDAQAWMMRVVPPQDQHGTPESTDHDEYEGGYRIVTRDEIDGYTDHPDFATPDQVAEGYASCYAEYYPDFKGGQT